jgi:single-strand DNA-binding protein
MFQQTVVVGRLGADPEMRYSANGKAVTTFSVAADSGFGDKKTTEWFRCVSWDKTAENVAKYMLKGSLVLVIGRLQTRSWEGQDGQKRYSTELTVNDVRFLDSRQRNEPDAGDVYDAQQGGGDIDPDDLPFLISPSVFGGAKWL